MLNFEGSESKSEVITEAQSFDKELKFDPVILQLVKCEAIKFKLPEASLKTLVGASGISITLHLEAE